MLPFLLAATLLGNVPARQPSTTSPPPPTALAPAPGPSLRITVDPGMELLAIMGWLAESYPTPGDSPYKTDAWRHFGRFRDHPVIAAMRTAGPLYSDFTEMGRWITGFPSPRVTLPDSSSWYQTMSRGRVESMLHGAIRFARDADFAAFRRRHEADYAKWAADLRAGLAAKGTLAAVEQFYRPIGTGGADLSPVELYLEPLNNWGAHMIDIARTAGQPNDGVIRFQFGPAGEYPLPSSPIRFEVSASTEALMWHEAGHALMRAVIDPHAARVQSLSRLFDTSNVNLKRQNVTTWMYAFEENFVRAVVATMVSERRGAAAGAAEIRREVSGGFVWVPLMTATLQREYSTHRDRYPTLAAFMERMLEVLEQRKSPTDVAVGEED